MGFGGGVVAMVHPIHAPIPNIVMKAMNTGVPMSQVRIDDAGIGSNKNRAKL